MGILPFFAVKTWLSLIVTGEVSKYCRFDRLPAANNSNIDHVWLEKNLVETVGRGGQKVGKHIGKSYPRSQKSWKKLAVVYFL